jgi:hypothetical protein
VKYIQYVERHKQFFAKIKKIHLNVQQRTKEYAPYTDPFRKKFHNFALLSDFGEG